MSFRAVILALAVLRIGKAAGQDARDPSCVANVGDACDPQFDPEYYMSDPLNGALCCATGYQCALDDVSWSTKCVARTVPPTESTEAFSEGTTPAGPAANTGSSGGIAPRDPSCSANVAQACDPQFDPEYVMSSPLNAALCCAAGLQCALDMDNWSTVCVARTVPPTESTESMPESTTVAVPDSTGSSGGIAPRDPTCSAHVGQLCDPQFDPEYLMSDPFNAALCCAAGLQCAAVDDAAGNMNIECVARTVQPEYTDGTVAPQESTTVLPSNPTKPAKPTTAPKTTMTTTKKTTTRKTTTKKTTTRKTTTKKTTTKKTTTPKPTTTHHTAPSASG